MNEVLFLLGVVILGIAAVAERNRWTRALLVVGAAAVTVALLGESLINGKG